MRPAFGDGGVGVGVVANFGLVGGLGIRLILLGGRRREEGDEEGGSFGGDIGASGLVCWERD